MVGRSGGVEWKNLNFPLDQSVKQKFLQELGCERRHSHHPGIFHRRYSQGSTRPWERTGGLAARICLEGTGETNDAYVCEIPAGKALKPQRHLFEELIYIVSGRGATTVWNDPAVQAYL